MKDQVKSLHARGIGIKTIARALGISKNTVRCVLREDQAQAETTKVDAGIKRVSHVWIESVDWQKAADAYRKGVTLKSLSQEHAPHVSYDAFRRNLIKMVFVSKQKPISMRLAHTPGEKTFIDFCDGIAIVNPVTGEQTKTELFVGVLPFSSYTFAEFVPNQKLETFVRAHESMWSYFGGVSLYTVVDNLKAGVTKAHLYDPDENKTYCEYANHAGFAVLPARPRKPRDKAAVEAAIGVIQRSFYMEVRNRRFYSLAELNETLKVYLKRLNSEVMKDYGVCRNARFEEEKKHLQKLPGTSFELCEWRFAKVHPDCEIQVGKNFYSVPNAFVGKEVRVRVSAKMVEVFDTTNHSPIAAHVRLEGIGKHARNDAHYPPEKIQQTRFEVQAAKAQAKKIGPRTAALIEKLFDGRWPLRGLRRAQGILRLAQGGKHSTAAIEHGADMALKFDRLKMDYIKACALLFDKNGAPGPVRSSPPRDPSTLFLHNQHHQ